MPFFQQQKNLTPWYEVKKDGKEINYYQKLLLELEKRLKSYKGEEVHDLKEFVFSQQADDGSEDDVKGLYRLLAKTQQELSKKGRWNFIFGNPLRAVKFGLINLEKHPIGEKTNIDVKTIEDAKFESTLDRYIDEALTSIKSCNVRDKKYDNPSEILKSLTEYFTAIKNIWIQDKNMKAQDFLLKNNWRPNMKAKDLLADIEKYSLKLEVIETISPLGEYSVPTDCLEIARLNLESNPDKEISSKEFIDLMINKPLDGVRATCKSSRKTALKNPYTNYLLIQHEESLIGLINELKRSLVGKFKGLFESKQSSAEVTRNRP